MDRKCGRARSVPWCSSTRGTWIGTSRATRRTTAPTATRNSPGRSISTFISIEFTIRGPLAITCATYVLKVLQSEVCSIDILLSTKVTFHYQKSNVSTFFIIINNFFFAETKPEKHEVQKAEAISEPVESEISAEEIDNEDSLRDEFETPDESTSAVNSSNNGN